MKSIEQRKETEHIGLPTGRYVLSLLSVAKIRNKPTTFVVSMEYTGFEPVASTMQMARSQAALIPHTKIITKEQNFKYVFRRKIV